MYRRRLLDANGHGQMYVWRGLSSSGFTWLTLASQLHQGRVRFNNVLRDRHLTFPDYPDSEVRCFSST